MTDPQTAADAAERVQAFVDNLPAEGDAISGYIRRGVCYELTGAQLRTLLADCVRMAAELEQVRGEREAAQHPIVAELTRLTPEQLSARRCAWCSPNSTMARLWCLCIAPCGSTDCKHDAGEADDMAADAAPDATGDTLTAVQRADGLRDLTKLEGPQRGSQGDGVLCLAGIPQDIADRAGLSRDALCHLHAGHADPTHDDGNGLSWQGPPFPPDTPRVCCTPSRPCSCWDCPL